MFTMDNGKTTTWMDLEHTFLKTETLTTVNFDKVLNKDMGKMSMHLAILMMGVGYVIRKKV